MDLDERGVVKTHDKINLIPQGPVEEVHSPSTSAALPVEPVSAIGSPSFPTRLMVGYTLPEPTLDLKQELQMVKDQEKELTNDLRTRIIHWLHADICRYELYPAKRDLYNEATRHLVFKYPFLGDKPGCGTGSWKQALKNRTKNQRRRMLDVREVAEERAKRSKVELAKKTPRRLNAQCVLPSPAPYDIGEDTASIQAHIEFLRKEMKKAPETRNEAMISDGMERTHVQRRAWIIENPRTVEEVLNLYPALEVKEEVLHEFFRMTQVHAEKEVANFFDKKGERVRALAQEKLKQKTGAAALAYSCGITSPAMEVIKSLAALLKDSPACLIEKEEEHVQPAFPVMQVREGASSSPLTVVLEDCSFEVTDIVAGIALILALYWVHDISYCPKASRSLAVIGNFIGLTYKTKSILVLDLISKLED